MLCGFHLIYYLLHTVVDNFYRVIESDDDDDDDDDDNDDDKEEKKAEEGDKFRFNDALIHEGQKWYINLV